MGNSWELHIALKQKNADGNPGKQPLQRLGNPTKNYFPESDFSYEFLDESIAKFYTSEQNVSGLLKWATGLAIFISCMGLTRTGYVYNQSENKRNRRSQSIGRICCTISFPFCRETFYGWYLIASIIAIPFTWWAMNKWLENFAFKTSVSWWVFALSALFMIFVALLTLAFQTIRAANANPVESLRTE